MPHIPLHKKIADNIYLNIDFKNNTGPGEIPGNLPSLMEYNTTKTETILDEPNNYYMAIVRFQIDLQYIPLFIFPIEDFQTDPNRGKLKFTIEYLGINYTKNVRYIPYTKIPVPTQNVNTTQIITPYYYIYEVTAFLSMINNTIAELYVDSGLAALLPSFIAPYFFYEPSTQLISLIVSNHWTNTTMAIPEIPKLFMNQSSFLFMNGFNIYSNNNGIASSLDVDKLYQFVLSNTIPNVADPMTPIQITNYPYNPNTCTVTGTETSTVPSTYYRFTQQIQSCRFWSSLNKIVFLTSTLPINNESVQSKNDSGQAAYQPILTDFSVDTTSSLADARSIVTYNPYGQYRLIDLLSTEPINKINVKVYWQDKQGNLYPVYLPKFSTSNMKLGFFKKSLYNNYYNNCCNK